MYKMPGNGINGKGKTKKAQEKAQAEKEESEWETVDNKGKGKPIDSKYVLWFHTQTEKIFATNTWLNLPVRNNVVKSWKQSVMGNISVFKKSIATREDAYLKSLAQAREPGAIYVSILSARKDADALIQVLKEAKLWMQSIIHTLNKDYGLTHKVLLPKNIKNPPTVDDDEIQKLFEDHDAQTHPHSSHGWGRIYPI